MDLQRLAAAWADTDGLVRAENAVLPAPPCSLEGITHLNLASVEIAALTGIPPGAGLHYRGERRASPAELARESQAITSSTCAHPRSPRKLSIFRV
jgi:hypothetical protein